MVKASPWPFCVGIMIFLLINLLVEWFHYTPTIFTTTRCPFINYRDIITICLFCSSILGWFWSICREAKSGHHTIATIQGFRYGMGLFIISEIMFFFAFFWAFFHFSVSPSIWIGAIWPPLGIKTINPWGIPFLNTIILLSSGVTVTWAHRAMLVPLFLPKSNIKLNNQVENYNSSSNSDLIWSNKENVVIALVITILYGLLFTKLQLFEYNNTKFSIADGVYGSTFFVTTGFHGLHVIIGTIFLVVSLIRFLNSSLTREYHFGFEAAIWYWHFVDVVWLFLFTFIYWWGSRI
jgi:cytochrome c oxidase subunit 3